jgi:hypothetical protein
VLTCRDAGRGRKEATVRAELSKDAGDAMTLEYCGGYNTWVPIGRATSDASFGEVVWGRSAGG